jgi:hypothetical protein
MWVRLETGRGNVNLEHYGWNDRFQSLFESMSDGEVVPARVIRVDRGAALVETGTGTLRVTRAGKLHSEGETGSASRGVMISE